MLALDMKRLEDHKSKASLVYVRVKKFQSRQLYNKVLSFFFFLKMEGSWGDSSVGNVFALQV